MSYVTLAEFKAWRRTSTSGVVGVNAGLEAQDDALLTLALDAAAERINAICGRSFEEAAAPATPRTFSTGNDHRYLVVDDCTEPITASRDGEPVAVSVMPHRPDRPVTQLRATFSWNTDVVVTAPWGWPATPETVKLANMILANKIYERRHAVSGREGSSELGFINISGDDKDVDSMLMGYVRLRLP